MQLRSFAGGRAVTRVAVALVCALAAGTALAQDTGPAFALNRVTLGALSGFDLDGGLEHGDPGIDNELASRPAFNAVLNALLAQYVVPPEDYGNFDTYIVVFELVGYERPLGLNDVDLKGTSGLWNRNDDRRELGTVLKSDGTAPIRFPEATVNLRRLEGGEGTAETPPDPLFGFSFPLELPRVRGVVASDQQSLSGTLGGAVPTQLFDVLPNPFGSGSFLDLLLDNGFSVDIDIDQDGTLDPATDGFSVALDFEAHAVTIVDHDGDGVRDDGDASGVAGDASCTGGLRVGCDDNCPFLPNRSQQDQDGDGVGDACDQTPTRPFATFAPLFSGAVDLEFGSGGAFGTDLYVSAEGSDGIVRVGPGGAVTPVADGLSKPAGLAFGGGAFGDALYVAEADAGRVSRIDGAGNRSDFLTLLETPIALAFGGGGAFGDDLYVTEQGRRRVLRVSADGTGVPLATDVGWVMDVEISTGGPFGEFLYLTGFAEGSLAGQVLRVSPTGAVTVLSADVGSPRGLTLAGGCLEVVDAQAGIRCVEPDGTTSLLIGGLTGGVEIVHGRGDAFGSDRYLTRSLPDGVERIGDAGARSVLAASLSGPIDLEIAPSGSAYAAGMYVVESASGRVSVVDGGGRVTPFAEGLDRPIALAFDGAGSFGGRLFVTEQGGGRIASIDPAGDVLPFVTGLVNPVALAFGGGRYGAFLYASEAGDGTGGRVIRIDPTGAVATVADGLFLPAEIEFAPGTGALGDALYLVEATSFDLRRGRVLRVEPDGAVNELVPSLNGPRGIAFSADGDFLFAANATGHAVLRVDAQGRIGSFGSSLIRPTELLFGRGGTYGRDLYVTDEGAAIQRLSAEDVRRAFGDR